jgi:exodeoxyribonuclease VII large subunit
MIKPLTVTELNTQIKSLLEATFMQVCIEAEISNLTIHKSGHIYFSLKDEQSVISAVMFKGNSLGLKFRLEEGLKVIVYGNIAVYTPRGNYQIICQKIEPSGVGALALAFEQLKQKLLKEGLFDSSLKKILPKIPKKIAIVTSPTGAAIEDMKKIANARWPLIKIVLIPTLVQGDSAALDISKSIYFADSLKADIIIVGRGGGSIEDLWAFNEEIVARAIFNSKTPIISAVGHESDIVISDFVADKRASTPSNAIELALPDKNEYIFLFDSFVNSFEQFFKNIIFKNQQKLDFFKKSFDQNSIASKLLMNQKNIEILKVNLEVLFKNILSYKQNELKMIEQNFISNDPSKKIKPSFAQILKNKNVTNANEIGVGDEIEIIFPGVILDAKIVSKHNF